MFSPVPFTPVAWTSIYTGSPMERHGVKSLDWRPWLSAGAFNQVDKCFWNILNDKGVKVELMNLPCTWPPKPVDRYMVSGFPAAPDDFPSIKGITYPSELEKRLPSGYIEAMDMIHWKPKYRHTEWANWIKQMSVNDLLNYIEKTSNILIDTFINFHSEEAGLGFIQFSFLDRTGHLGHGYPESLKLVNVIINRLTDSFKPENILIISDHGEALHPSGHKKYGTFAFKGEIKPAKTTKDVEYSVLDLFEVEL